MLKRLDKLSNEDLNNYQKAVVVVEQSLCYVFNREEIIFPRIAAAIKGEIELLNCQLNCELRLKIKTENQILIKHISPKTITDILIRS
jgi:hypothetical protein